MAWHGMVAGMNNDPHRAELAARAYSARMKAEADPSTLEAVQALYDALERDPDAAEMFLGAQGVGLLALSTRIDPASDPEAFHEAMREGAFEVYMDVLETTAEAAALHETKIACERVTARFREDPGFVRLMVDCGRMAAEIEAGTADAPLLDFPDDEEPKKLVPGPTLVGEA